MKHESENEDARNEVSSITFFEQSGGEAEEEEENLEWGTVRLGHLRPFTKSLYFCQGRTSGEILVTKDPATQCLHLF